jgi:hypothetical protein
MRHTGSYGAMTAGLWALLFATAATYGLVRLFLDTAPAVVVSVGFAGLVALWVLAYFSGGGRSVRRAFHGWVVTLVAGGIVSAVLGVAGAWDEGPVAVTWIVAWLIGAALALGTDGRDLVRWRLAAIALVGIPAAVIAVAIVGLPIVGVVCGVALLAVPLALADWAALRQPAE